MKCPYCNAAIVEGNVFCLECGKPLAATTGAAPPLQEVPRTRSSGKCPARALPILFGATVGASLIVGLIYHFVTRFFDLLILFPLGVGFILGAVLAIGITAAKCRNPAIGLGLAILAAVLTYGTKQYADAVHIRGAVVESLSASLAEESKGSPEEVRALVDAELTPWIIMTQIRPEVGTSIGRIGRGGNAPIKGGFYWGLLLVETALIAWMASNVARAAASEPFCEKCDRWSNQSTLFVVHPSQSDALLEKVCTQDWKGLINLPLGGTVDDKNHCDVAITRCGECRDTTVTVNSTSNNKTTDLFNARLAPESVALLIKSGETSDVTQNSAATGPDASPWTETSPVAGPAPALSNAAAPPPAWGSAAPLEPTSTTTAFEEQPR